MKKQPKERVVHLRRVSPFPNGGRIICGVVGGTAVGDSNPLLTTCKSCKHTLYYRDAMALWEKRNKKEH